MTKLLQIYPSDEGTITCKCLRCKNLFHLCETERWNYCPKCGVTVEQTSQTFKRKEYRDNFGCHVLRGDEFVHDKSPEWKCIIETSDFFDHTWQESDTITGPHRVLKRWAENDSQRPRVRLKIIPSKVSPLP